jgi:hypothetical protein
MNISVIGCKDCPFFTHDWADEGENAERFCKIQLALIPFDNKGNVKSQNKKTLNSCKLNNDTITIKLIEND